MGLDISFDRSAAIAAGMKTTIITNGTEQEIAASKASNASQDYISWLESEVEVVNIPNTDVSVINDSYDGGSTNKEGIDFSVRANKWGRVYYPLTEWLTQNNIAWREY